MTEWSRTRLPWRHIRKTHHSMLDIKTLSNGVALTMVSRATEAGDAIDRISRAGGGDRLREAPGG